MHKRGILYGAKYSRVAKAEEVLDSDMPDLTVMKDPDVAALHVAVLFGTMDQDLVFSLDYPSLQRLVKRRGGSTIRVPTSEELYRSITITYALYYSLTDSTISKKDLEIVCEKFGFQLDGILEYVSNIEGTLSLGKIGKSLLDYLNARMVVMSEIEKIVLDEVKKSNPDKLLEWYSLLSTKMKDVGSILQKLMFWRLSGGKKS
jgi:hypothetical protein